MRLQRVLVGVLGSALLGALPVALTSSSADAGAALASNVDGKYYGAPDGNDIWRYGQKIRFEATVTVQCDASDSYPYDCPPVDETGDTISLQRQMAGSTAWRTVNTKQASGVTATITTTSVGNAIYRIVYSGGTSRAYAGSESGTSPRLKGSRNPGGRVVTSHGRLYYRGDVNPGWGRKVVTIQKKSCASCAWRKYKSVRTSRNGSYSVRVGAPRRGKWFWRSTVAAASPRFVRGYGNLWTTRTVYGRAVAS
ncbi:hypothetical protein EKO23_16480 [Nocardioides guangzhouensis]|uniref:Uncharacterized protein n=1 Tax=Nocardioides guangzhouensis TaxID=2497878 RepID=A0A4Q4Z8V5_9ACTN|nr:hypothetical protein [Nocardioides guangzhouensis]RYP84253.1 hypothetical protein EKO23_16480 [Nocardioides guangzhouensis]